MTLGPSVPRSLVTAKSAPPLTSRDTRRRVRRVPIGSEGPGGLRCGGEHSRRQQCCREQSGTKRPPPEEGKHRGKQQAKPETGTAPSGAGKARCTGQRLAQALPAVPQTGPEQCHCTKSGAKASMSNSDSP